MKGGSDDVLGENNGTSYDALEPEGSVVLAGMGEGFAWLAAVVDKENNLGPDQSQSGPSEEMVGPFKRIVEPVAHVGVGKYEHHQE